MKGIFKTISKSHKSDKKINDFKKKKEKKVKGVVLMQIQVCVHVCWTFPTHMAWSLPVNPLFFHPTFMGQDQKKFI